MSTVIDVLLVRTVSNPNLRAAQKGAKGSISKSIRFQNRISEMISDDHATLLIAILRNLNLG